MSVAVAFYGRLGPQAGGNQRVAELLRRTVDGQHRASVAFKATLDSIKAQGLVPWTGSIGELTLLLNQWITLLAWERVTVLFDAAVTIDPDLGDAIYRQADRVCGEATDLSMQSIRMHTEAAQGKRPGNASLASLSLVPGNASNTPMVWVALEAVYTRVRADLHEVQTLGVPPRMGKVYQALLADYQPVAEQFEYLLSQWHGTSTAENRVQLVRQAIPLAQQLYTIGQQVWAPYLAGPVYIDIVRSMPLFAKLGLPFDPWVLTAPTEVATRVTDRTCCQQLIEFWQTVADPLAAKALQDSISEAIASESVVIEAKVYQIAPWAPQYRVVYAVTIDQQQLEPGMLFMVHPKTVGGKRVLEIRVAGRVNG